MSCRSSTACWASADRVTSPDCPSVFLQTLLRVWPVLRKTVDPVDCTPSQQRSGVVYRIPATVRCGLQDPSNGQVWSTGSQQRSGVVYRIPATVRCTIPSKSYAKVYIGQTLEPHLKEHRTALMSGRSPCLQWPSMQWTRGMTKTGRDPQFLISHSHLLACHI